MDRREFLKRGLGGIVVGSVLLVSGCGKNPVKYSVNIDLHKIKKGTHSGMRKKENFVFNHFTEWNEVWKKTFKIYTPSIPDTPNVNFLAYEVLAVYMGFCPNTGYEISIIEIIESNNNTTVKVSETFKGGDQVNVATHPYHMVYTAKLKKPVIFEV